MESPLKKRKYGQDDSEREWNRLSRDTQNVIAEAYAFFEVEAKSGASWIQEIQKQTTIKHSCPYVAVLFHFITSACRDHDEGISRNARALTERVHKKFLDPRQKDHKKWKFTFLEPLLLSWNELVFYWFVIRFEVGRYLVANEVALEEAYLRDKPPKKSQKK